jgi:hypothetical protein
MFNQSVVTRSHKFNDRVYGEAALEQEAHGSNLPRFFGKNAGFDTDPKKTKKDGGGKGNWYALVHSPIRSLPNPFTMSTHITSHDADTVSTGATQAKKPKTSVVYI